MPYVIVVLRVFDMLEFLCCNLLHRLKPPHLGFKLVLVLGQASLPCVFVQVIVKENAKQHFIAGGGKRLGQPARKLFLSCGKQRIFFLFLPPSSLDTDRSPGRLSTGSRKAIIAFAVVPEFRHHTAVPVMSLT